MVSYRKIILWGDNPQFYWSWPLISSQLEYSRSRPLNRDGIFNPWRPKALLFYSFSFQAETLFEAFSPPNRSQYLQFPLWFSLILISNGIDPKRASPKGGAMQNHRALANLQTLLLSMNIGPKRGMFKEHPPQPNRHHLRFLLLHPLRQPHLECLFHLGLFAQKEKLILDS